MVPMILHDLILETEHPQVRVWTIAAPIHSNFSASKGIFRHFLLLLVSLAKAETSRANKGAGQFYTLVCISTQVFCRGWDQG